MYNFESMRSRFAGVYNAVKQLQMTSGKEHRGHGFADHTLPVAMMAIEIAVHEEFGPHCVDLALLAGLLHTTDRLVDEQDVEKTLDEQLALAPDFITLDEKAEIKQAVLRHCEFKDRNIETRSVTQKLLMDADKLVNMNMLIVIRCGQFRPEIPAIEVEYISTDNPTSTYRNPSSVIRDIEGSAEWAEPGWIHFPYAQNRADALAEKIRHYVRDAKELFVELGLADIKI